MIRNIVRGIRNVIHYLPIIWRDRDWDHTYLLQLMEFKLRRMSKFFKEEDLLVHDERSSKETLICAELLKRLVEDDYCSKEWDEHYAKFPWEFEELPDGSALKIGKKGETNSSLKILRKSKEVRKVDEELFFKIFKRKYTHWWN